MSGDRSNFLSQPVVKNVLVYRNGDPFFEGRRLVVNEKRVSSFESFLKEATGGVQAPFGAVRNIYTPRAGHRVGALDDLQNGEQYVAAGREKFKKIDFDFTFVSFTFPQIKPVAHSRIVVSARFLRPIQEPCAIFVIANGDILNPAVRLLIPRRIISQWELVLEMITEKMSLRILGAVRSLCTLDGNFVRDGKQLENGQFYVAVGREKFKKLPYGDLIFTKPAPIRRYNGSKTASLPPIFRFRKHKESVEDRQSKSTGGSSDTGDPLASPQPPKMKGKKAQFSAANDAVYHGKPVKRQAETVDEEDDVEETLKDEELVEDNKWESEVHGGQEADGSTEEDTVASWSDHEEDLINDNKEEPPQETPEEPPQETPEEPYQEMPELEEEESRKLSILLLFLIYTGEHQQHQEVLSDSALVLESSLSPGERQLLISAKILSTYLSQCQLSLPPNSAALSQRESPGDISKCYLFTFFVQAPLLFNSLSSGSGSGNGSSSCAL
ncbi:Doublecortin domain-containing protein 2 [Acipenser ruthenus]|uniref:Doublecortin domain-containing protein 2 n=1 Tax=Acipenser ruthenus TaxID=7906 RepID=A0A444UG29_ACIRT|nr:Doublecortin domain-containing protein 2 [Acipenser ruthenus]